MLIRLSRRPDGVRGLCSSSAYILNDTYPIYGSPCLPIDPDVTKLPKFFFADRPAAHRLAALKAPVWYLHINWSMLSALRNRDFPGGACCP